MRLIRSQLVTHPWSLSLLRGTPAPAQRSPDSVLRAQPAVLNLGIVGTEPGCLQREAPRMSRRLRPVGPEEANQWVGGGIRISRSRVVQDPNSGPKQSAPKLRGGRGQLQIPGHVTSGPGACQADEREPPEAITTLKKCAISTRTSDR